MDKQLLLEQAKQLLSIQPGLTLSETPDALELLGSYILDCSYHGVPLYDVYEIKILVPWDYPTSFPKIWETGGKVPRENNGFMHVFPDGSLCLGVTYDLISLITSNSDLSRYVCPLLDSYFYSATYYREYGVIPEYGERPHGDAGIIEAYKERYQVSDEKTLFSLLPYSAGMIRYRGHLPCPCCSGKRMRNCHGKMILSELKSDYAALLSREAKYLIEKRLRENNENKRRYRATV